MVIYFHTLFYEISLMLAILYIFDKMGILANKISKKTYIFNQKRQYVTLYTFKVTLHFMEMFYLKNVSFNEYTYDLM